MHYNFLNIHGNRRRKIEKLRRQTGLILDKHFELEASTSLIISNVLIYQTYLIILTNLKFCSNLTYLFAEPNVNNFFFIKFESYRT